MHCLASVLSLREPARPNWWIGGNDSKYVCVLLDLQASLYKYNSADRGLQGILFGGIISFAFRICLISCRRHEGLCYALSLCFRAISILGTIINALIHRSDLMTFISFTLATFQTWKYNFQPHIWTPEMITFFLAEMTLSAGSVSLQAKQTDYWVNSSPICKSQTSEVVLRKKIAQKHLSQLLTHHCTDRECYLEVSHQLFLDFVLQENVGFHLWISTCGSPVPETFRVFTPEVVKWMVKVSLSWTQFCLLYKNCI